MSEEAGLLGSTNNSYYASNSSKKKKVVIVGVVLVVAWTIAAFVLSIVAVSKEVKREQTLGVSPFLFSTIFDHKLDTLAPGKVLSYDDDGLLAVGAGTTIYRNISTYHPGASITHLDIDTLSDSRVIMYHDGFLITGDIDDANAISWNTPETRVPTSRKRKTMSSDGEFVVLASSLIIVISDDDLFPAVINADGSISLGPSTQFFDVVAVDTQITRLSDTAFAISFFDSSPDYSNITLATSAGYVSFDNTGKPSITLTPRIIYSPDHNTHSIVGMSNDTYILLYPNTTSSWPPITDGPDTPMIARLVTVSSIGAPPNVGPEVILTGSSADYFFGSVRLRHDYAVVVFVDLKMNNGLRAVALELFNVGGVPTLNFGSSLVLNNGDASGILPDGVWMFISVSLLSDSRFLVVYSDLANEGRVTAIIGELTDAADLVAVSPQYVISGPNPDESADYYWISAVGLSTEKFIIVDALTGNNGAQFTIGEMKQTPFGIVKEYKSESAIDVYTSGVFHLPNTPLIPGKRYYATTRGDLVYSDKVDGRVDPHPDLYIVSDKMIISMNSYVGIAISSSQIAFKG